jgi:Fe2+ or Zn2+ uptake regulation protein
MTETKDATQRDRVWAAVLEQSGRFETGDLYDDLPDSHYDRPSHETIKRVLRAATELGVVAHKPKSPTYRIRDEYNPYCDAEYEKCTVYDRIGGIELRLTNTRRRKDETGRIEFQPDRARELGEKLIEFADKNDRAGVRSHHSGVSSN